MSNSNLFIDNEVHIWIGNLKTMPCLSKAKSRMHILNNDEISSLFDYPFIKQRNIFLLSRVMLRDILSFYLKISPEDVRFSKNEYGKPFILNESKESIYFNLSHSNNCVALAISNTSSVGVDIEYFNRDIEINSIIDYYFSKKEKKYLSYFDETQKKHNFYKMWTLKEAYIKSRGIGLSEEIIKNLDFYIKRDQFDKLYFIEQHYSAHLSYITKSILDSYKISIITYHHPFNYKFLTWGDIKNTLPHHLL